MGITCKPIGKLKKDFQKIERDNLRKSNINKKSKKESK